VSAALISAVWVGFRLGEVKSEVRPALPSALPEVVISVTAVPESAQVFIDGQPVATKQAVRRRADALAHELRVQAPGYRSITRPVRLDRDLNIVLELGQQLPPSSAASEPTSGRPTKAARRSMATTKNKDACSPPFTLNEAGLRFYRVECL
jgi:hypothetical protein